MLVSTPAGDVGAQQRAPEKPARDAPKRAPRETPVEAPKICCKVCDTGKACGKTCINRQLTCHKPPGCACNAGSS